MMTAEPIKQKSEFSHPLPTIEASERAERDRDWGPGRQTALRYSPARSPQGKRGDLAEVPVLILEKPVDLKF